MYDGGDRTCELRPLGDGVSCAFRIGSQQIAFAGAVADPAGATAAWLLDRVTIGALARLSGVELERYAEVLEQDPARWHWLHVRDRLADPDDVLRRVFPLLEALAASPIATRFYTFSSLWSLCFSSSSHYPWVLDGLPAVWPAGEGSYQIGEATYDVGGALAAIEAALGAAPVAPFFGTSLDLEAPALHARLAAIGSALVPALRQREQWREVIVEIGERRCNARCEHLTFEQPGAELRGRWSSLDTAARAIHRYLELGATLDELAADPDAIEPRLTRPGPGPAIA